MSLLKELERHGDQGWTYSSSYDRNNTNVFNNTAVDSWPSPVSQTCAPSDVSTPGSVDSFVQEIKSSDTDSDEVLLVDDPGGVRVPATPSQQSHLGSSVYQNSFGAQSPHSLAHSGLLLQPNSPVSYHSQSAYFQPHHHHAGVRLKQMQLPLKINLDHAMHTPRRDIHPHGSHLRSVLLEHQVKQQPKAQALHLPGSIPAEPPHQQNSRTDRSHHLHRDQPFLQNLYVDHSSQHQHRTDNTPIHQPHGIIGQVLPHHQSHGSSAQQRHNMTEVERNAHLHSTYGKQQMVTMPHVGAGSLHSHVEQKGRREQEKVKLYTDSYISQRDQQQHGSFGQHHNTHHTTSAPVVQHNPGMPTTADSGGPGCHPDSSHGDTYIVPDGKKLEMNTVYHLTNKKTGTARVATWDGKKMVSAESYNPNVDTSAAGDAWDANQSQLTNSGTDWGCHRDPHSQLNVLQHANQRSGQTGPPPHMANSQQIAAGTTCLPVQDNSVSPGISQAVKPFSRLSATNEVWPTPMPSLKSTNAENAKEPRVQSPDPLPDICDPSESQATVDSQVIEVSPPHQNYKEPHPVPTQEQSNTHVPQVSNPAQEESNSAKIKRKLKDDEEAYAVCRYCGYTSTNIDYCEGCSRKLPTDVKVCIKKRRSAADSPDPMPTISAGGKPNVLSGTSPAVDKKSFYGNKLKTQAAAFGNKMEEMSREFDVKPKRAQRGRRPTARSIGRGRKIREMMEPVTVILSSDDDEPKADTPRQQTQQEEEEMPFFPAQSAKPTAFGTSRRERMQDEAGRCVTSKNPMMTDGLQITQQSRDLIQVRGVRVGSLRASGNTVDLMPNVIHFDVNSDRTQEDLQFEVFVAEIEQIKYTLNPMQPVCFIKVSPACGSRLRERLKLSLQTPEYFDPGSQDTKRSFIVIIIETILNEEGLKRRLQDYQKAHSSSTDFLQELCFDEANSLLVKSTPPVLNNTECNIQLKRFHKHRGFSQGFSTSPSTISSQCSGGDYGDSPALDDSIDMGTPTQLAGDAGTSASDSPCAGNKEEPMPSRSPSPKIGFVGPVEKLLTYPPPPAKGGITITNEDLFCLNEGEFLNDVILDFYLKYLFREKLSEADRQRTHIFSSFFYKRLMQRQSRSMQDAEDALLTPAQRRHSRVKTWTRHVDIFAKDYLLIPINEHSHWFLAVICFPGLDKAARQMFEPVAPALEEPAADSNNENGNSKMSASPSWPDDTMSSAGDETKEEPMDTSDTLNSKAILGNVIQNLEESKCYTTGVKQACILILDSLAGPSRNGVIKTLKEYLQVEWDLKKKTPRTMTKTVRGGVPRVPQQTNYSDCGVFVLQYAESFFESPICDFSIPMKGLNKWFPLSKVEKKRQEIRNLILKLQEAS